MAVILCTSAIGVYADIQRKTPMFEYKLKDYYETEAELKTALAGYTKSYKEFLDKNKSKLSEQEKNTLFRTYKDRMDAVRHASDVYDSSYEYVVKDLEQRLETLKKSENPNAPKVHDAWIYALEYELAWFKNDPTRAKVYPYLNNWTLQLGNKYIESIDDNLEYTEFNKELYTKEWNEIVNRCLQTYDAVMPLLEKEPYKTEFDGLRTETKRAHEKILKTVDDYCVEHNIQINTENAPEILEKAFPEMTAQIEAKKANKAQQQANQQEE